MEKRTILTYAFCGMTSICSAYAQMGDMLRSMNGHNSLIRGTVFVYDTVCLQTPKTTTRPGDIIRIKAIRRYDCGIINYRLISKDEWIGGATASYVDFDSQDSCLPFSLLKGFDCHIRTASMEPLTGYAVQNNVIIGVKLDYNHIVTRLDNLTLSTDDLDFSLKDIRCAEDTYGLGLLHHSYVGLDAGRRFGLSNEITLLFNTGTTRFFRGMENAETAAADSENAFRSTETTLYGLHSGIDPGITVFIIQNVSVEVSFGVIGFKYNGETRKSNLGETDKRHNSGANFKINLFNTNMGVTFCL